MIAPTFDSETRPRVLIVYGDLLDYRVPIFSMLGEACELTVTHSGSRMTDGKAGFTEIILPRHRFLRFHIQRGLRNIISNNSFDTIIYFMDISWLATVFNFLLPPRPARRVIWGLWRTGRPLADASRLWLAKQADHNVFYSNGAAEDFIACGLPPGNISVARNTVRIDTIARNETTLRDTILVVGSFNARKENDVTLAAFETVAQTVKASVRLVFVGSGDDLGKIKALAAKSSVADRIEFHPACHDEQTLREFYDRAICSVSHGQAGLSVLQSFAYGVPFVTREGAISGGEIENIEHGVNGILTSGSQTNLEMALRRLIENPSEARAMGRAALDYYRTRANAARMVDGFLVAIEPTR